MRHRKDPCHVSRAVLTTTLILVLWHRKEVSGNAPLTVEEEHVTPTEVEEGGDAEGGMDPLPPIPPDDMGVAFLENGLFKSVIELNQNKKLNHNTSESAEVTAVLSAVVRINLDGCYKVVLHSGARWAQDIVTLLSVELGEGVLVWKVDKMVGTPPPEYYLLKHPHPHSRSSQKEACVVFITIASLHGVGIAFESFQRGGWFLGTIKYFLAYTGSPISKDDLYYHKTLNKSYNLVVVSRVPAASTGIVHLQDSSDGSKDMELQHVYTLMWMCPYCNSGDPEVKIGDFWSPNTGFRYHKPLYPDLFKNFNGHVFRAVTLVYEPFSCYEKVEDAFIPTGNCVDNNMLSEMGRVLNFSYIFVEPRDGQWGHRLENGSYTGVIGTVERMEADFSLNIAITQDREEKVDCTIGYHVEPITFATSLPRLLSQSTALIRPFTPIVWLTFFILLLVSGPLYYVISCLSALCIDHTFNQPPSFTMAIIKIFGACFWQGTDWVALWSSRVFVGGYVLTMFVTVHMYVAMLTASLTVPQMSQPLNWLEEVVESGHSWGIQDLGAADYQMLKTSTVPLYQRLFQGLDMCPSLDECIQRARDQKYAFITWRTYLQDRIAVKFTSSGGERQVHIAYENIFPSELGWAMNPGSPYRPAFNRQIRALLQSGHIAKWLSDLINDPRRRQVQVNEEVQEEDIQPLDIDSLQGVFYLLVIGCFLSLLVFLLELWIGKETP